MAQTNKYKVMVDDNFHFMDEDERYQSGVFDTYEEAVNHCKQIVSQTMPEYKPGMTAKEMYESYTMFSEDPFIVILGDATETPPKFSAWDYAKQCSEEIVSTQQNRVGEKRTLTIQETIDFAAQIYEEQIGGGAKSDGMHLKFTPRLELAIRKTSLAHAEQKRKGSGLPYIIHPFSVMCIASEVTDDEDILIACLLHDVIEDVPERYSAAEIQQDFGKRVLSIVEGVTKDSTLPDWQARADAYLAQLRITSIESVTVSAADKIHNLMSVLQDYEVVGEDLWKRFNAGKERQQWWYREVLCVLQNRIPDSSLTTRLEWQVIALERLL